MSVEPRKPTSPDTGQILVFTPGNTPKRKIAATLAKQRLLADLRKEEPKKYIRTDRTKKFSRKCSR